MLEYQEQDCDLTLAEGLECYYNSFPESKEVFKDNLIQIYGNLNVFQKIQDFPVQELICQ